MRISTCCLHAHFLWLPATSEIAACEATLTANSDVGSDAAAAGCLPCQFDSDFSHSAFPTLDIYGQMGSGQGLQVSCHCLCRCLCCLHWRRCVSSAAQQHHLRTYLSLSMCCMDCFDALSALLLFFLFSAFLFLAHFPIWFFIFSLRSLAAVAWRQPGKLKQLHSSSRCRWVGNLLHYLSECDKFVGNRFILFMAE